MQLQTDNLGKVSITVEEGYWDIHKDYDKLTVVEKEGTFGTFISRKPVPAGIELTNREYWIPFSSLKEEILIDYNAFLDKYKDQLDLYDEAIEDFKNKTSEIDDSLDKVKEGLELIDDIKDSADKLDEFRDTINTKLDNKADISDLSNIIGEEVIDTITEEEIIEGLAIKDDNYSDFSIADDDGNIVLQCVNGHIKTKNFNSENIQNFIDNKILSSIFINKFKDKKIAIIGDSISTYNGWLPSDVSGYTGATYATYYPSGNVNDVSKTWWHKVATELGINPITNLSNCSWSGSKVTGDSTSTNNAHVGCSTKRINDISLRFNGDSPDIIICYISCNDWGTNVEIGNWNVSDTIPNEGSITTLREAYALMLYKIQTKYPLARIFCCTNLDDVARDKVIGWPSNNSNGISTYEWNTNIIEIAQAFGCDIIDLHSCGINYSNLQQLCVDNGLHPNEAGHTLIAKKVVAELFAKY